MELEELNRIYQNLQNRCMKNINIPYELNQINVADLHAAFKKLKIEVASKGQE